MLTASDSAATAPASKFVVVCPLRVTPHPRQLLLLAACYGKNWQK
jgi:hypothetical protein